MFDVLISYILPLYYWVCVCMVAMCVVAMCRQLVLEGVPTWSTSREQIPLLH